ncbi:MAG: hypothetical protein IKP81_05370 [Paludibacteraceae bacterium]|nr:hypothetical protein [Paludibacteraceae bacterium]
MDVDDDKEPNPGKKKQVNVFLREQERNIDDAGTNDGLAMPSLQADACSVADAADVAGDAVASAGDELSEIG